MRFQSLPMVILHRGRLANQQLSCGTYHAPRIANGLVVQNLRIEKTVAVGHVFNVEPATSVATALCPAFEGLSIRHCLP